MRRYWIPKDQISETQVTFSGEVFHHIFDVCRQEVGSHFEVLGDGKQAHLIEVTSVEKKRALGKIIESRIVATLPKPYLVLALSIPRFPVMDAVVEKAVEMGVARIQPFYSEFSFIRKSQSLSDNKFDRWKKIIVSATQQSGRGDLMELCEPQDLSQVLEDFNQKTHKRGLFAYEGSAVLGVKEQLTSAPLKDLEEFWVFVGSEGGFSTTEVQEFRKVGLETVTLGDQVLRVETACIALLAVLKYELGQMVRKD